MSEPEAPPPMQDQLMREAASWFARMRGPEAQSSQDEFEAWLRRGALHRGAYNRAAEIFAMGKVLGEEESPPTPDPAPGKHRRRSPGMLVAVAGALLLLVMGTWLALGRSPTADAPRPQIAERPFGPAQYSASLAAPAGQTRRVPLPDGSAVTLKGGTLLAVRLGPSDRRFHLARGEARFEVFREPRPFIVNAGGGAVTARGTIFDVGITSTKGVTVRLIEGVVEVALPAVKARSGSRPAIRRLRAGETVSFAAAPDVIDRETGSGLIPQEASNSAAAARHDTVREYDGVSVAALIAEANLHTSSPIRLTAAEIGTQRVSGRFRVEDSSLIAERLALLFDLTVERRDSGEIILRRR